MNTRFLIIVVIIAGFSFLGMDKADTEKKKIGNSKEKICVTDLNKPEFKNISFKAESSRLNATFGCGEEKKICGFFKLPSMSIWLPFYGTPIVVTP